MRTLLRSISGGFGRVLGRFLFYILIGFIIYLVISKFNINIKEIFPNIERFLL